MNVGTRDPRVYERRPKGIAALDGGAIRGIVTLSFNSGAWDHCFVGVQKRISILLEKLLLLISPNNP